MRKREDGGQFVVGEVALHFLRAGLLSAALSAVEEGVVACSAEGPGCSMSEGGEEWVEDVGTG